MSGSPLAISDPRERRLVRLADLVLGAGFGVARMVGLATARSAPDLSSIRRALLFRLERAGDLLATLPAIAEIRRVLPEARLDLVVGSWNERLARASAPVDRVLALDVPWIVRDADAPRAGQAASVSDLRRVPSRRRLIRWARGLRSERYDLAADFQGDVRTNLLMWLAGARWRVGFAQAGGGAPLTAVLPYDDSIYMGDLAMRVAQILGGDPASRARWRLRLPEDAQRAARALLSRHSLTAAPVVIHPGAGRAIKQWPPERFARVADAAAARGVPVVLTGAQSDRELADAVLAAARSRDAIIDLVGATDVLELGGVFARAAAVVTPDTGPLHLAAALGVPVVAIFGPSDPRRYFSPRSTASRLVRIDLPCSPCNRIRLPPARCVGHTPDCLAGIDPAAVLAALDTILKT